jgi:hypothetical protein
MRYRTEGDKEMQGAKRHPYFGNPVYWRKRSEEVRAMMVGEPPAIRDKLRQIAEAYEDLAKRAEERRRKMGNTPEPA